MKTLQQKIEKAEAKMPQPRTRKWMKGDLVLVEPTGTLPESLWMRENIPVQLGIVFENRQEKPRVLVEVNETTWTWYFHDSSLTLISDQEFVGEEWL